MTKPVQFDSYGGIDVLEVRDVPRPVPGAGEVLVEVRAAGINPSEAVIRSGALHHLWPATFPSGQGSDLAGVVAELGPGVSGFAVGDEVIGFSMRRSSHAEYVTVPANQLTPRPATVPWEVAGSLFVAGVTAYARYEAHHQDPLRSHTDTKRMQERMIDLFTSPPNHQALKYEFPIVLRRPRVRVVQQT